MKTKYQVGDKAYHITLKKYGTIKEAWNDGLQRRYVVRHSGWSWSVPQTALRQKARP